MQANPETYSEKISTTKNQAEKCISEGHLEEACRTAAAGAANALMNDVYNAVQKELNTRPEAAKELAQSQNSWRKYREAELNFREPGTDRINADYSLAANRTQEIIGLIQGGDKDLLKKDAQACLSKASNPDKENDCIANAAAKTYVQAENAFETFAPAFENNPDLVKQFNMTKQTFDEFRSKELKVIDSLHPNGGRYLNEDNAALKADLMRHRRHQIFNVDPFDNP